MGGTWCRVVRCIGARQVLWISVLFTVGVHRRLVGESAATVTTKINGHTMLFERYCGCNSVHVGHVRPCIALDPPYMLHASCVVSVRCFLGARLAGTGLLCTPTVYSGSAPNGYTNNLGVTRAIVMLSMGQ